MEDSVKIGCFKDIGNGFLAFSVNINGVVIQGFRVGLKKILPPQIRIKNTYKQTVWLSPEVAQRLANEVCLQASLNNIVIQLEQPPASYQDLMYDSTALAIRGIKI
jgi:hypothetical protein